MRLGLVLTMVVAALATGTGCGQRNPASSQSEALAAPSELGAKPLGAGLHLTWKDNSSNEEDFELERKTATSGFATVVNIAADGTQYHDEAGLVPSALYTYRVRARTSTTYSSYSNEVSAFAPVPTVTTSDAGSDGGNTSDGGIDGGSNQPPSCTITAPVAGRVVEYDVQVTFVASATDPEDGTLSGSSVVWTTNLSAPPLGTGLSFTRTLPSPGVHTVTCTVTDSDGATGISSVVVTSRSPVAVLNHPGDGETRPRTQNIPFIGDGRDFEDGALPDAGLVWTSSIDGVIGTGRTFNRQLSPGTNSVTLTVTDSQGNTGTKTITLTITP